MAKRNVQSRNFLRPSIEFLITVLVGAGSAFLVPPVHRSIDSFLC